MTSQELYDELNNLDADLQLLFSDIFYDNILENEVTTINELINTVNSSNVNDFNSLLRKNNIDITCSTNELKSLLSYPALADIINSLIQQVNNDKEDENYTTLNELVNKSPEFFNRCQRILLNAWKQVLTKESLVNYIEEECQNKVSYDSLHNLLIADLEEFFAPDIGDILAQHITIPDDIFYSDSFIDDIIDLMSDDEFDRHFFRVVNSLLLPLTKKKVQVLKDAVDKVGDDHDIDLEEIDIHNREKPFLIIDKKIYLGGNVEEHQDISKALLLKKINDKNVAVVHGHIIDGIAFIDLSRTINPEKITKDELKHIIENEPSLEKAYTMPKNHSVTRLAKRF